MQLRKIVGVLPVVMAVSLSGPAAAQQISAVKKLPQIVVSASRVPIPSNEVGSAVTVIEADELERRQIRTVSDALRDVPGVAVSQSGPTGSLTNIRIRGAESNQTLVLIDGIEVSDLSADSSFDFGNLRNAEIDRIEVLRGPQSALYGSDAIGGVVNIVTKRPDYNDGASAKAEVQYGPYQTLEHLYRLSYGGERAYITSTLNQLWTDGISIADDDNGNTESDGYENTTVTLKLGVTPFDFLEIELNGLFIKTHLDTDGGTGAAAPDGAPLDSMRSQDMWQRFGQARIQATFFDGHWENIARASYGNTERTLNDPTNIEPLDADSKKTKFDYQSNFFVSTPALAGAEHSLTLLVERETEEQVITSPHIPSPPPIVKVINYGYAAEYRLSLMDSLFLSGSARYDDNAQLFKDNHTFRGTAAYLFDRTHTRLHGSYGQGVKNPTLTELFGVFSLAFGKFIGNPSLMAEQSEGWDAGIEQSFFDDRLTVDVTWFTNYITDLITTVAVSPGVSMADNLLGITEIHGVELTVSAEPVSGLEIGITYTYTNGQDPKGVNLLRRPMHIGSLNANYTHELFGHPANFNASIRYHGEQSDIAFEPFPTFAMRPITLDDYVLFGLAGTVEIHDGFEFFVRGENLLDQDHEDVFGAGSQGISGSVGLRVELGK